MPKQTYLHKRAKSAVYYFRCRIPNDLLSCYEDKSEIVFSLKTRDHHEAMRRVAIEAGKQQIEFEALRRSLVNAQNPPQRLDYTDAEIERLGLLWTRCVLETDDQQRLDGYPDETFDEQGDRLADTEHDLKKIYARGDLEKIYPALDGFLALTRTAPPDDPAAYRRLAMSFLKSVLHATQLQLARQAGEMVETEQIAPADKVYVEHTAPAAGNLPSSLDLVQLLQNWHGAVPHRARSTVDAYTAVVKEFKAWSKGISADKISRQDILGYRDHLLKEREQHHKTAEKKIGILCSILQLAVDEERLPSNAALRIKVPKPKFVPKPRIPYSALDMQKVLGCPIYTAKKLTKGAKGNAARWLPLLCMYSGARLEEMAQIHAADIVQDPHHGWYFDITDVVSQDADIKGKLESVAVKRLKNNASRRRVPVHPELVNCGFLRFVQSARSKGQLRLFPQLVPDSKGAYSGSWSKWWGIYARKTIGIFDPRKVFHSYRHGFKDACREAGISEDVSDALTGHTGGGVGRKYGNDNFPLGPLVRAIALISYPGISVPLIEPESLTKQ